MPSTPEPTMVFKRLRFCVRKDSLSKSLFWISHLNDGSVIVEISYANPSKVFFGKFSPSDVSGGNICYADHGTEGLIIPKFVYHTSGQTHFSKDPDIRSAYPVQHIPLTAISQQTEVFAIHINGDFSNFDQFDEEARKKRDLKDQSKNVVFGGKFVTIREGLRHRFRFMIDPADGFYQRHPILKKDCSFYPGGNGEVVFLYNLYLGQQDFKCIVVYDTTETPQNDNHVILFGSVRPQNGWMRTSDEVQFIVLNC